MACLVIIDLDTEGECVESSNTAILTAYDMTLILALACAIALGVLLKKATQLSLFSTSCLSFCGNNSLIDHSNHRHRYYSLRSLNKITCGL
ncbi:unnamed protein product, partial [Mesorhabditis belari]|uniref:Uncharacterized protein n=1 Tax=Mesorhabditis belari TaxID=2138241 RepID=A0AAF3FLG8_9BILA